MKERRVSLFFIKFAGSYPTGAAPLLQAGTHGMARKGTGRGSAADISTLTNNDFMGKANHAGGISVVINTYNASRHLERVLESVSGFDEVVVCDMESTDGTADIARRHGCRVVTFEKNGCDIVEPARQFAIGQASQPWVLVVDADELVPAALRDYLYGLTGGGECPDGLWIPRKNYFMGRFLHSCYPDYILRFFRKEVTTWPPVIHTAPKVCGRVERIPRRRSDLAFDHLANDSVGTILRKTDTYSDHELPRRRHKGYGTWALMARPAFRFFKSYVIKRGFLDGLPGLIHAALDATYQFAVVAKLIEERLRR